MHVKEYGIYIAWPPAVDLRTEGLGRHLAMFLKGASEIDGVRFTVVCPSWSKDAIEDLARSEQLDRSSFEIVAPKSTPYILKAFELLRKRKSKSSKTGILSRIKRKLGNAAADAWSWWITQVVEVNSIPGLVIFALQTTGLFFAVLLSSIVAFPFAVFWVVAALCRTGGQRIVQFVKNRMGARLARFQGLVSSPLRQGWVARVFEEMHQHELQRMHSKIEKLKNIRAWYCPTSFWPQFNNIPAPRLMCVPDVVLSDFPAAFSKVNGDNFLKTFETIGKTIRAADHFVTYSSSIKWKTLVARYSVPESSVVVIPHAPMSLEPLVKMNLRGGNSEAIGDAYCRKIFLKALQRTGHGVYTEEFDNEHLKFIFYASQIRPSKNVLTLLRAYEYLLRKRYIGVKLILTGSMWSMPEIADFVTEHRLERDVLFMHGLSVMELAACYRLACLAVNPTLSEGGCPFTLTEALSVGTPVVMSRISVTEEVVQAPKLREMMLFDPFDWRDCAMRIEWAINNSNELLDVQLEAYSQLRLRTWKNVVGEHVDALERISSTKSVLG